MQITMLILNIIFSLTPFTIICVIYHYCTCFKITSVWAMLIGGLFRLFPITITVATITFFVICFYTVTHVITFFTKSIGHNYLYKSLKSHSMYFFHNFLIILFILNIIEIFVRVFSSPSTTIFNSPITSLHLPIRNFIFHSERWNTPY